MLFFTSASPLASKDAGGEFLVSIRYSCLSLCLPHSQPVVAAIGNRYEDVGSHLRWNRVRDR
jgi:hypothetical protein